MENIYNKNMSITNTDVWGLDHAMRGMRNPFNSHKNNDSYINNDNKWVIGENDMKLAQKLIKAGSEHAKFLRQIHVSADFTFPRFIWQEMDTYKFMEKNSESTIHKLLNNENPIDLDKFIELDENDDIMLISTLNVVINYLESLRKKYLEIKKTTKDQKEMNKLLHIAKIVLPEGFLQTRTIDTNYAELRNMWLQRVKTPHRMKEEWVNTFGAWIDTLPYADELIKLEK